MGGSGVYSAYIGAVVDMAKIFSSMHTAHFRYIPALALPSGDTLNLRLATPPSFRNPKSVVVVALPVLGDVKLPPLHPVNPSESFCVAKPDLVLPVEGAPLVFATEMAHDLVLHLEAHGHDAVDLPVVPDISKGGLVLAHGATVPKEGVLTGDLTGILRGKWGFDDWTGPHFRLHAVTGNGWTVAVADQSALVVGREDTLHMEGENTLCVDRIEARGSNGTPVKVTWKSPRPETLELNVALKDALPGQIGFSIYQFGQEKPRTVEVKAYADAASIDLLTLNAGDQEANLKGTRLDEVASVDLDGIALVPATLGRNGDSDMLTLKAASSTAKLKIGARLTAKVTLRDGRMLRTTVTIEAPRPQVTLASKGVQAPDATAVTMGSPDDLPLNGRLVFFLKSVAPPRFPRDARVELAAVDGSFHTVLTMADGSLILQDAHTVMGSLDPQVRFGPSAFGPVQLRVVAASGTAGSWIPLGTLVRLPSFKELRCVRNTQKSCTLTGANLFLAVAFSSTRDFVNVAEVPPEFTGTQIMVPHPSAGVLYMKLRDDPEAVAAVTLPVTSEAKPTSSAPLSSAAPGSFAPASVVSSSEAGALAAGQQPVAEAASPTQRPTTSPQPAVTAAETNAPTSPAPTPSASSAESDSAAKKPQP